MNASTLAVPDYRHYRTRTQLASIAVFALIPLLGIFRIDLTDASLMILWRHVYLRDFMAIAGLAIIAATGPLLTYSTIGTVWCGWACPHNTVSEWANRLTRRLLGARADVSVEGAGLEVAPSKNRLGNWLSLIAQIAAVSLVLGVLPLLYFFPPKVAWSLLTFQETAQFSRFMFRLYLVSSGLVFVDIALIRYFLCNYLCLYRFGQFLFKTKDALHIAYDETRSADCAKCNYCRVSCVTGIDPTRIKFFDRCINCGECIDACSRLHLKKEPPEPGLIRFEKGEPPKSRSAGDRLSWLMRKFGAHGALFLVGCVMLLIGWLQAGNPGS